MARFKLKDEHVAMLQTVLTTLTVEDMELIQLRVISDRKFKDPLMRLRWDCLYAAFNKSSGIGNNPAPGQVTFVTETIFFDAVYLYATDCHIDTVLKALVQKQFGDKYLNFTGVTVC